MIAPLKTEVIEVLWQDPNGNPTSDGLGNALIVGPELVASPVDRRGQVQGVWCLHAVGGSQLRRKIEDRGAYSQLSRSARR